MDGVRELSLTLSKITSMQPDDVFDCLVGQITFEAVKALPGRYDGYVAPGVTDRIKLRIGKVTKSLVIHELGHIINDRVQGEGKPAFILSKYGIKTISGKMVTGPYIGGYSRHMGRYAPKNGYITDTYPHHYHSRRMKDGNSPMEDWADMLLSLVTDNFTDDEAGQALRGWITDRLLQLVQPCKHDIIASAIQEKED